LPAYRSLAVLAVAALALSACSKPAAPAAGNPNDPYSGLEPEVLAWRTAIEADHPICKEKVKGKGCEAFEVTCKAAQEITPDETKAGVTAKIVAAMTFSAKTADGSQGKSGSAFAYFSKAGGKWARAEAKPVNPSSCAPL